MDFRRSSFKAAFCVAFMLGMPLAGKATPRWYQPKYLTSVEEASNRLQFFSPHFAPTSADDLYLTIGYSLQRVDVNKLGINLSFTKSGAVAGKDWNWSPWLGLYDTPTSTPFKDDIVTTIVYADVSYLQLFHNPNETRAPATWCVEAMSKGTQRNSTICLPTETDALGLGDALATMVVANGGSVGTSSGVSTDVMSEKDFRNHPERAGLRVSFVHAGGPPAEAGIQEKDVIHAVNGTQCTKTDDLFTAVQAAAEKPGGGDVNLEILRKGATMSIAVHYPHAPEANVAQLRAEVAEKSQRHAAAPAAVPGAAPAGPHLGIRVRAVTDADVADLGLPKPKGLVVTGVDKGGFADEMQMQAGDVIVVVNGSEIGDIDSFSQVVRSGAAKTLRVWRKGKAVELTVPQTM